MVGKLKYTKFVFDCNWHNLSQIRSSPLDWRDAIEWHFRKTSCIALKRECYTCNIRKGCPHALFFHPNLYFENIKEIKGSVPFPFVPEYPKEQSNLSGNGDFSFGLILFGRAIEKFPYWIVTIERIGKSRFAPFTLKRVYTETNEGIKEIFNVKTNTVYLDPGETQPAFIDYEGSIVLDFSTPLRLLIKKKPVLNPNFSVIFQAILNRVSSLCYFYGEKDNKKVLPNTLRSTETIRSRFKDFYWKEQVYYSKKQKRSISLSGLMGRLHLEGNIDSFQSLLHLGAHWGIGKGTALGLGRYNLITI